MSLLDQLIEKKDIDAYCRLRGARLKEDSNNITRYPEAKRELIKERLRGRMEELARLRGKLHETEHIKRECKSLWRHFDLEKRYAEQQQKVKK